MGFGLGVVIPERIREWQDSQTGVFYLNFSNSTIGTGYDIDYIDFDPDDGNIISYRNINGLND